MCAQLNCVEVCSFLDLQFIIFHSSLNKPIPVQQVLQDNRKKMYIYSKRLLIGWLLFSWRALFNFCRFGLWIFKGAICNPLISFQSTPVCGLFYYTPTHPPTHTLGLPLPARRLDGLALHGMLSLFIFERTNTRVFVRLCVAHSGALCLCVCMFK